MTMIKMKTSGCNEKRIRDTNIARNYHFEEILTRAAIPNRKYYHVEQNVKIDKGIPKVLQQQWNYVSKNSK